MTENKDPSSSQQNLFSMPHPYQSIIDATNNVIYWVDNACNLKGWNRQFTQLLGLDATTHLSGTPYEQIEKFTKWPHERINTLKLDDMNAIFHAKPQYKIAEPPFIAGTGEASYFYANRVPLFDIHKRVIGLVVVLSKIVAEKQIASPVKSTSHDKIRPHPTPPMILMIEDLEVDRHVEGALFTAFKCQVDFAKSGSLALTLFKPGKYDLILMDISLGDTSGYLLTKKLRQMEENTGHHAPIIALTAYSAGKVKEDCYAYSMDGVVEKPLTDAQVDQMIKRFVYKEDIVVQGLL